MDDLKRDLLTDCLVAVVVLCVWAVIAICYVAVGLLL